MEAVARPRGIGGSDAAAALGLNPYESPVGLWLRLTGREEPRDENEAMGWGKRLQPLLAQAVEEHGYSVMPAPTDSFVSADHPFMFGTLDGFAAEQRKNSYGVDGINVTTEWSERGVLELKTAGTYSAKHWDNDEIPLAYQAQCLHYMAVTGLSYAVVGCLIGGQRFVVRRMERDDRAIAILTERESEFWQYVQADTPPPPEWATAADLAKMFPDSTEAIVTLDDAPDLVEQLRAARAAVEVAKAEQEKAEAAVKARMGEAGTATLHGGKVFTWRTQTARRVDVKRLKDELPDVHGEYSYESPSRVFRVY